jgi:hypothetical protein
MMLAQGVAYHAYAYMFPEAQVAFHNRQGVDLLKLHQTLYINFVVH